MENASPILTALQTVISNITGYIDLPTVASIIGAVVTAGIGFVLLWRFAKWAIRKVTSAISRGKATA